MRTFDNFFLIIRYAYQKMQNGLKRMFFMKEKNFGSKKVFNGYPCKNVTKYLTPILVAARGLTPSTVYGPVCNLQFFLRLPLMFMYVLQQLHELPQKYR